MARKVIQKKAPAQYVYNRKTKEYEQIYNANVKKVKKTINQYILDGTTSSGRKVEKVIRKKDIEGLEYDF